MKWRELSNTTPYTQHPRRRLYGRDRDETNKYTNKIVLFVLVCRSKSFVSFELSRTSPFFHRKLKEKRNQINARLKNICWFRVTQHDTLKRNTNQSERISIASSHIVWEGSLCSCLVVTAFIYRVLIMHSMFWQIVYTVRRVSWSFRKWLCVKNECLLRKIIGIKIQLKSENKFQLEFKCRLIEFEICHKK